MLSMLQPELCSPYVQLLGQVLGGTMLLSIEVAVEYWLALTWCPQAQWLNDAAQKGQLQDEVRSLSSTACLHFLQAF